MAHGYAGMANFVFLQMGLTWVIGCTILFAGAYLMGSMRGGRAAAKYTAIMTWMFLLGFAGIIAFAYFTGEAQPFLQNYGYAVIIEMMLLSLGCVWIMWFMATQYSRGRIAIDERFGSKDNYLRAKEAAKRASSGGMLQEGMPIEVAHVPVEEAMPALDAGVATVVDAPMPMQTIDPVTGQVIPEVPAAPPVSTVPQTTGGEMVTPLPLGPSAPNVMPESNEQWLQQLDPAAESARQPSLAPDTFAPAPAANSMHPLQHPPAIDPYTGQPLQQAAPAAPAHDPFGGQPMHQQPAPAPHDPFGHQQAHPPAAPAIDPYTGQPMQSFAQQAAPAAPAIDPYTGQPMHQQPAPPAPAPHDPFGHPQAHAPAPPAHDPFAPTPAVDPYTGQPIQPPPPPYQPPAAPHQPQPPQPPYGGGGAGHAPAHDPFAPTPAVDPYTGQLMQPAAPPAHHPPAAPHQPPQPPPYGGGGHAPQHPPHGNPYGY